MLINSIIFEDILFMIKKKLYLNIRLFNFLKKIDINIF